MAAVGGEANHKMAATGEPYTQNGRCTRAIHTEEAKVQREKLKIHWGKRGERIKQKLVATE